MMRPLFCDIGVVFADVGVGALRFFFRDLQGGGLLTGGVLAYDGGRMAFRPGVQSLGGLAAARKMTKEERIARAKLAAAAPRRQYGPKPKVKAA
jgi:hypothetical protein